MKRSRLTSPTRLTEGPAVIRLCKTDAQTVLPAHTPGFNFSWRLVAQGRVESAAVMLHHDRNLAT